MHSLKNTYTFKGYVSTAEKVTVVFSCWHRYNGKTTSPNEHFEFPPSLGYLHRWRCYTAALIEYVSYVDTI